MFECLGVPVFDLGLKRKIQKANYEAWHFEYCSYFKLARQPLLFEVCNYQKIRSKGKYGLNTILVS